MSIVTGVFSWQKISVPDEFMGTIAWKINIEVDDAQAKKLITEGKKPNKGETHMFSFKRKTTWPSGEAKVQPRVVDENRIPIDPAVVGNGSSGKLQYLIVEGKNKFGSYKLFDFQAIQVLELVRYEGGVEDGAEFEDDSTAEFDEERSTKTDDTPF